MSWGERSCKGCRDIEETKPTMATCNVDCKHYEWDGSTKPDSTHQNIVSLEEVLGGVLEESKSTVKNPTTIKTGRNQACPCGSGKKYKKCCFSSRK